MPFPLQLLQHSHTGARQVDRLMPHYWTIALRQVEGPRQVEKGKIKNK